MGEKCERCDWRGLRSEGLFCTCQHGMAQRTITELRITKTFDRAGLPERFFDYTLSGFKELADEGKMPALRKVGEWLKTGAVKDAYDVGRPGIFLHGENGVGKTGLMAGLHNAIGDRGGVCLWIKYTDLLRDVQSSYGTDKADARVLAAQRVGFLFIDDVGDPFAREDNFSESEDRRRIFFDVLSYRHERHKPMFMTANFEGLDQLAEQFDTRIADRVMELCAVIEMKGRNLRIPA